MQIGGFQKFSLIDYPGKVSCVIFTQGCNFRCPFCHNRELVANSDFREPLPDGSIIDFLRERVGRLEGVVITGGEPTLQSDLVDFVRTIKSLGFVVKLDTNGSRPDVLAQLFEERLIDYVAMDIKAPLEKYDQLSAVTVDKAKIKESIRLILENGPEHQFRTTMVKPFITEEDLIDISTLIQSSPHYTLQEFFPAESILNRSLLDQGHFTSDELEDMRVRWERTQESCPEVIPNAV